MTMKKECYTAEFKEVYDYCIDNDLYLGEGNPNARILIIGKECAIAGSIYEKKEKDALDENLKKWKSIIENPFCIDLIKSELKKQDIKYTNVYYPLFPHLGQKYLQRRKRKDGSYIGDKGTAPTWYFYQKLVDIIMGNFEKKKENYIDFHLNSFHSELSQIPSAMSNTSPKELVKNSIKKRSELFRKAFFRQFPIVILAAAHYPRDYSFNIQEIFDVKYEGQEKKENWINIHSQKTGTPRILLHTRQLSMISNDYIGEIAELCKQFYK